jgi:hypothetical protein
MPGTVLQSNITDFANGFKVIRFECTGDASNGSIPDTAINAANMQLIKGISYLYSVSAYPTAGGTAPDAADVFILDANGEDLLGSADGGTTAKNGLNLIHATLKKTTFPYSAYMAREYFPAIINTLTLKVANQATINATYTIELVFVG